jgi:ribonuclease R
LSLIEFLKPLGYDLELEDKKVTTTSIKKLLAAAKNTPEENIISRAAIQTMAKAVYSLDNIGHYGLAFPHYTHFTSPIRRYPDLLVHRLLALYLDGQRPTDADLDRYGLQVIHSTTMERVAMEAERASIKLKQAEFFTGKIGEIRQGIISGVTDFGLFIEDIETGAEGLVHISKIGNERFEFQPKTFSLVGERTKTRYRLGDELTVKVKKTIPERGLIDWELVQN